MKYLYTYATINTFFFFESSYIQFFALDIDCVRVFKILVTEICTAFKNTSTHKHSLSFFVSHFQPYFFYDLQGFNENFIICFILGLVFFILIFFMMTVKQMCNPQPAEQELTLKTKDEPVNTIMNIELFSRTLIKNGRSFPRVGIFDRDVINNPLLFSAYPNHPKHTMEYGYRHRFKFVANDRKINGHLIYVPIETYNGERGAWIDMPSIPLQGVIFYSKGQPAVISHRRNVMFIKA